MSEAENSTQGEETVNASFKWLLVIFPAGIFLLGFVSIVYYLNGGFDPDEDLLRTQREVASPAMAQMIEKLELHASERNFETEQGRRGMRSVLTMFESSLGARNAGYEVSSEPNFAMAGELWPLLSVEIEPRKDSADYVAVLVAATAPAATHATVLAALEAMATLEKPEFGLVVIMVPVNPGLGFDDEQGPQLREIVNSKLIQQIIIFDDLGSSESLRYFGKWGTGSTGLIPGLSEGPELEESLAKWQPFLEGVPAVIVSSKSSSQRLDAVSQAELARQIETMLRRMIGG